MKVVGILGGLGSQMCKYAFYLALKSRFGEECYIDTTYFRQKNSWNGYELKTLFNVDAVDIADVLPDDAKERILNKTNSYLHENIQYLCDKGKTVYYFLGQPHYYSRYNKVAEFLRVVFHKALMLKLTLGKQSKYPDKYLTETQNAYFDEYLMNSDELFRSVKDQVVSAFQFPEFDDVKNQETSKAMLVGNSVAVHVRRTDHLGDNGRLYERRYYAKAVQYIKENAGNDLQFFVFSDDIEWCKNNLSELGLVQEDAIVFVDWNSGKDSYKDMQLMTACQHNVLAISSFSWWGYYLSKRNDKIICAPEGYWTEVKHHF